MSLNAECRSANWPKAVNPARRTENELRPRSPRKETPIDKKRHIHLSTEYSLQQEAEIVSADTTESASLVVEFQLQQVTDVDLSHVVDDEFVVKQSSIGEIRRGYWLAERNECTVRPVKWSNSRTEKEIVNGTVSRSLQDLAESCPRLLCCDNQRAPYPCLHCQWFCLYARQLQYRGRYT